MLSFAASSAAARAGKSGGNTASAMAQLYVYEAAEQCASIARELTGALQADEHMAALLAALTATRPPTFVLREEVASHILAGGGYSI